MLYRAALAECCIFGHFSVPLRPLAETVSTVTSIRDEEPRMATSTFTQLLTSGQFSVVLRPQRPQGLLGTSQDGHLDFQTAPEL